MRRMLVLLAVVAASVSGCTKESATCRKMEALCGTAPSECREQLDAVKEVAGQEGVDAVARCYSDATTCAEASGCMAGEAVKGATKSASEFLEGMKKSLDKK